MKTASNQPLNTGSLSQWQLVSLRFRKHKLAVIALYSLGCMYLIAIFAGFVAPYSRDVKNLDRMHCPPQLPRVSLSHGLYTLNVEGHTDPMSLQKVYRQNRADIVPLGFFVKGDTYRFWGLFETDRHLLGVNVVRYAAAHDLTFEEAGKAATFHLMGCDRYGRDLFSRIIYGSRISLSIGLLAIVSTFVLGLVIGGVSGYMGGKTDMAIQRLIEIMNAIPRLPMWLALGAAVPAHWSGLTTYFCITLVLSLLGWTSLARVVRGKILSLREEDYAVAARLLGASDARILFLHLLPGFTSHILVELTLRVPVMILGETSLSFLGLGLRPPTVSWGVLLQDCMSMRAVAQTPWLLLAVVFIIVTVLSFNFLGDGLRDAADPYH